MYPFSSRREVFSISGVLAGALAGCLGEASPGDPEPSVSDETLSEPVRANVRSR